MVAQSCRGRDVFVICRYVLLWPGMLAEPVRHAKPCSVGYRFPSRFIGSGDGGPTFGQPNDGGGVQRLSLVVPLG